MTTHWLGTQEADGFNEILNQNSSCRINNYDLVSHFNLKPLRCIFPNEAVTECLLSLLSLNDTIINMEKQF